jgi:hypothetical protein
MTELLITLEENAAARQATIEELRGSLETSSFSADNRAGFARGFSASSQVSTPFRPGCLAARRSGVRVPMVHLTFRCANQRRDLVRG